jgi:antitoxin MazE
MLPCPMVKQITLRQAGGSVTATLPKEIVERLQVGAGDRMYAIETEHGVLLTPFDPDFHDAMSAFGEVRRQYRNALKKLSE